MKKLLFSFFLICCAVPLTAEAADLFNTNGSFKVAKAVKLGRGSAYSVSASSNVNTGGKISSKKTCSAGCSDCDTSTGWCNACKTRYAKDNAGKCHSCSSNCASCWMEYGDTLSCETCDSGYELATNSVTGAGPFYCKKIETVCLAGTYRSGSNNCVTCPSGTYSTGSNATSCQSCSTLTITEYGSNISCGSSCTTTGECTSCPYGYYRPKTATVLTCNKCRDGCSACSDSSMGVYCTACEAGYTYTLDSYNMGSCAAASSGSNSSGSNTESAATTCSAGYYLSGSNCVACASGTYSKGGTVTSCSSCSTLYTSAGSNTCTSCTTTGTCTGSNGGSSSSSGSSSSCTPTIGYTCVNGVKTKCMYEGCASCATDTLKCVSCKPGYAYTAGSNCSS